MAFYEGIDEEIYAGGDHYMPMQQFRLHQNFTPRTVVPETIPTSTNYGIPTLYPYGNMGGDGGYRGGGLFGNLDTSNVKMFDKQVWEDADANAPGSGGWIDKQVKGYYNPDLGQYQTFEGKNINHLGLEVPTIAGALFDKSFGKGPQPGDIKGTFTGGWDEGMENIKEGWEEEKDKWAGLLGIDKAKAFFKNRREERLQEEILAHNQKAAAEAAAATARAESERQYNPNVHGPTNYGVGSDGQQSYDSGQGFGTHATSGGPVSNRTGRGRQDWAYGGIVSVL